MFVQGDVFIVLDYQFPNSGRFKDKYFISMNTCDNNHPCLALITTSQRRHFPNSTAGCNHNENNYLICVGSEPCFILDTFIKLPQLHQFSLDRLNNLLKANLMIKKPSLSQTNLSKLKNCLAQYRNDIAPINWKQIY